MILWQVWEIARRDLETIRKTFEPPRKYRRTARLRVAVWRIFQNYDLDGRCQSLFRTLPAAMMVKSTVSTRTDSPLAEAASLDGEALSAYLEGEGVKFAEYEQWRIALDEGGAAATATNRRIRSLERELARKEKALAEVAALLLLKKKVESLYGEGEGDDTNAENEQ